MKRKMLLLPLILVVMLSSVVVSAYAAGWESFEYQIELGDQENLVLRYVGNKVLQTFTQEGTVKENGDVIGTISIEVFYQLENPVVLPLKGHAVAKFTMNLEGIGLVEGVMEARIIVDFVPEQTQTMTGRFNGHGDINIRGTLNDLDGNPNVIVLEGYAK